MLRSQNVLDRPASSEARAAGFSAGSGEKSRDGCLTSLVSAETAMLGGFALTSLLGVDLATSGIEKHHVFRAALLSIVLSLAAGENAVILLCNTWCDAHAATASECHHENSSDTPSVAGGDCGDMVAAHTAILREDTRRDVSSADASQAIPAPRYQLAQLTLDARFGQEPRLEWSLEEGPLSTVLRL